MDGITPSWKLVAARGGVALAFGLVAFLWPAITLSMLVVLFGAYTLADGLVAISVATREASVRHHWALAVEGLLGIALGLVAVLWTRAAVSFIVYGVGTWAILTGALELIAAQRLRLAAGTGTMLRVSGVLSLVLGFVVLTAPYASAMAFVVVLASYALTFGAAMSAHALELRRQEPRHPHGAGSHA